MSTNSPDPHAQRPGALQSMLARLRGMYQSLTTPEAGGDEDLLPTFDTPPPAAPAEPPVAQPVETPVPLAEPVGGDAAPAPNPPLALPATEPEIAVPTEAAPVAPAELAVAVPAVPEVQRTCPVCSSPRRDNQAWCDSCGYLFPPDPPPGSAPAGGEPSATGTPMAGAARVQNRYELGTLVNERGGVERYHGLDHGAGGKAPVPVVILRMPRPEPPEMAEVVEEAEPVAEAAAVPDDDILPTFEEGAPGAGPITERLPSSPTWPGIAWERNLLEVADHPSLPAVRECFVEDNYDYLVEELPAGRSLWDAWDDPASSSADRFGWLRQIAAALVHIHEGGAILEGLRPDIVVIEEGGRARLTDLSDLLPLPLPPDAPIRATLYTAPELTRGGGAVDARADLYSFGAMLYALHVGRELTDTDFERPGVPKPFIPRFPDTHPLFGRLMHKTFVPEVNRRLPTDEAGRTDATGFQELIRILEVCGRTLDDVHLEVAAWTTTGMVRTGNEDAYALLQSVESRMDDQSEAVLGILCDGMGGYEAGEVAAALAIQALRKHLLQQKMFSPLSGGPSFPPMTPPGRDKDPSAPEPPPPFDLEACKRLLKEALKDANKQVFNASRTPSGGRRTMGCTAEVVYVNGQYVVVGHVGDSRTYHLHEGRLIQLTRDQTLVNRLVELGTLTAEEAENHPRKNELQQAIGGQPDVEPGVYHGLMRPGDWVVICSDGVSNHVTADELKQMLLGEASSAEQAARRLVNFVNIKGATDNATIVIIRAT